MKKFRKSLLGAAMAVLAFPLLSTMPVQAGINSHEQSVINAASGTFYYGGQYYKADPGYMSQLVGKLDSADVDLSPADADTAINKIYSSVGEGVEKGYIVPTTGASLGADSQTGGEDTQKPKPSKPAAGDKKPGNNSGKNPNASGNNSSNSTEGTSQEIPEVGTGGTSQGADETSPQASGSGRVDASGNPIPDGVVIINEDGSYSIQGEETVSVADIVSSQIENTDTLQKETEGLNQEEAAIISTMPKEEEALVGLVLNPDSKDLYVTSAQPLSEVLANQVSRLFVMILILLAVVLVMFSIAAATHCGKWQKNRSSGGHALRSQVRHIASVGSIVIATVAIVIFSYGVSFVAAGHIEGDGRLMREAANDAVRLADYQSLQEILIGYSNSYMVRILLYGLLLMAAAFFLIVMVQSLPHRGVRYIRYGTMIGGIITLILTGGLYLSDTFANIHISPDYTYIYLIDYMQNGLLVAVIFALLFIMASLALYPMERHMRKRAVQHG